MEQVIVGIKEALIDGDAQVTKAKTENALAIGISPKTIIEDGLLAGMKIIGHRFRENEIFIPDVLMSSRAMHASLWVLQPLLSKTKSALKGKVVLGTVAGDLHDIGKNMVGMILEGAGYEVIDIGIDVPPEDFVAAVQEHQPDILAMSALLTTTMGELGEVVTQLKQAGLRKKLKILIGGGPVTPEFALGIEADAYGADAYHAVEAADRLLEGEIGFFVVS